ncbi:PAS domain S-box protein, partial [Acidiphilium multivorum]|nr:PAS domain S-box protein [Acidiphilium multivorum]
MVIGKLRQISDKSRMFDAIGNSFGIIGFKPDGTIIDANDSFLRLMGYGAADIIGRHHRIFVTVTERDSAAYGEFWQRLRGGAFCSGEFRRIAKSGHDVWLRASYVPVRNRAGKVAKVVKVALDITAEKRAAAENESILNAIERSQAVIKFALDGTILEANDNFLRVMGYARDEIVGRKHSMFATPAYAASREYQAFWERLRQGEFIAGDFERVGKGGRHVWLQATYNPVYDAEGKVTKVVKFAVDLTERMAEVGLVGDALERVSEGDLTASVDRQLIPSLDKLRIDFNTAASRLAESVNGVRQSTDEINLGVAEIADAAEDLARRTEQQASTLEETSSVLDSVTTGIRRT